MTQPQSPVQLATAVTPFSSTISLTPTGLNRCIHDLITERALQKPEAPAVCSWDGSLSYSSLEHHSSLFAQYLQKLGAEPEIFIPFCFEKSLFAVISALAILKSGAAFVALDPETSNQRRNSIIQETAAKIVIVSPAQASLFHNLVQNVVIVDWAFLNSLQDDKQSCRVRVTPKSPAFVLFTSGSTGKPKGIVQEHRAVCKSFSSGLGFVTISPSKLTELQVQCVLRMEKACILTTVPGFSNSPLTTSTLASWISLTP
jgi:non-ribosomal peptide synthetase component F